MDSTVCRFLSTRIMCLGDYHICTVHSYILQVLLSVLSCPGHVSVSGQQGHSETTLRRCRGSQSSNGWSEGPWDRIRAKGWKIEHAGYRPRATQWRRHL